MNLDYLLYKYFKDDYGRYVDDFYIVTENKELVKEIIPKIEKLLYIGYGLTLHPNKRYSQPVKHGCKFIGYVVKGDRIYVGNSTVSNLLESIKLYNKKEQTKYSAANCVRSLNSYLGYLSYCNSYNILKKYVGKLDKKWYPYFKLVKKAITEKEIKRGKIIKISIQFKPNYKILNKY